MFARALALVLSTAPTVRSAEFIRAHGWVDGRTGPPPPPPPSKPLAAFRFATVYADHMVLQRAPSQASVWGFAAAGATVSVKAGAAAATATASAGGIWRASLPAQPASTAAVTLSATSGGKTISVSDVLFGDVRRNV